VLVCTDVNVNAKHTFHLSTQSPTAIVNMIILIECPSKAIYKPKFHPQFETVYTLAGLGY